MVSWDKLNEQLQAFDFDALAHRQANAQRRLRLLGLAHLKEGKSYVAVAQSLRVTRHAVMRWADWFATDGIERLSGVPQGGRPPRLGKAQQEAVRRAIEQAQDARGGGRILREEIRQLLREQFHVDYSLNGVYHFSIALACLGFQRVQSARKGTCRRGRRLKKMFALQVQSVVPPHVASDQVDIWFQDEMRIGQRGTQTPLWSHAKEHDRA